MRIHSALRAVLAAALAAGCADETTAPVPRLSVSPAVRVFRVRDDSVMTSADSALVAVGGAGADTVRWVATHTAAPWVSLVTAGGTGGGVLRWTRDASWYFAGTYVDTITVKLLAPDSATVRLVDSLVVVDGPPRYVTVRRAWRPGERDSLAAAIVALRLWAFPLVGDISDLAPAALAHRDSTTEVIQNPLWRPAYSVAGVGELRYDATFLAEGLDLQIVFDPNPFDAIVERDSLPWRMILWYKSGAQQTAHGFVVRSTPLLQWSSKRSIKTADFDANGGHPDYTASGEVSIGADTTYWEGYNGGFVLSLNGNYGTQDTLETGPFSGGNIYYGQMTGSVSNNAMACLYPVGCTVPEQKFSATWTLIYAERIRCYWPPITPPTGFSQCTGQAFGNILAAARAFRPAGPRVRARQAVVRRR